ncbi:MAG: DsbA family protein [Longimicrobiales bacterium]|nr:DsbA family protein [Longimicrobiales bacterium]
MNAGLRTIVMGALMVVAACSSPDSEGQGTEDLTRNLLAQPVGDGTSTPLAVDEAMASQGPRVSVAEVGFNRGDTTALVKVVEMSDYGCGYCRQFHEETFGPIREEFIATGMVEWKFVPYITGMFENSLVATEAAECTYAQSPEAFETLNARLWADQSEWKSSSDPESVVQAWVTELGIDMETFNACQDSDERIVRVASATTLAGQIGVRGTPTFVVLGWPPLQGALPLQMFRDVLTAAHNQLQQMQDAPGEPGTP